MIKRLFGALFRVWAWAFLGAAACAYAQGYPKGAINLVIPYAAADATDIAGRAMADDLARLLKVPVIVINRPGAGGALGTESVVKAAKDGYTLLFTTNGTLTFRHVIDPATAAYDATRDLAPLGLTTRIPSILAIASTLPYRNFAELVDYAKKNPGQIRIGTAGAGSVGDFTVALIDSLTGAEITTVPFKGASPAVTAMRGGHVEGVALALGVVSSHMKSGAVRGIATSARFPEFPDMPTLAELGYKQNLFGLWLGFYAPAGVPPEVASALVPAIEKAAREPAVAAKLVTMGMVQEYAAPETELRELRDEQRVIEELAKRTGLVAK